MLCERKEAQKADREKAKQDEEAARAAAPPQERAIADAKDLQKSIPKAIEGLKSNGQKLGRNPAASSLVAAATALSKKLADNLKQIQAALKSKNGKAVRTANTAANKLLAEKTALDKPMKAFK